MTVTLLVILSLVVAGMPLALLFDRHARGPGLLGFAFLVASTVASLVLLALSLVGIRWSLPVIAALLLSSSFAALVVVRRRARSEREVPPPTLLSSILDGVTLLAIGGFSLYATMTAPWEWDFWAIWGLKARAFLLHGGIDWNWLAKPFNDFVHPDYPPLLPLLFDLTLLPSNQWSDRWLGVLYIAFAAAAIAVVRDLVLRSSGSRNVAAAAGLAAAGTALSTWLGMAEIPLIAFAGCALLYLRAGLKRNEGAYLTCGSLLLGAAALTKNEGVALVVAATAAVAVTSRFDLRKLAAMWPAFAMTALWQMVRLAHGLHSDLFGGDVSNRVASKLENAGAVVNALVAHPPDRRFFWLFTLIVVLVGIRYVVRHERFLGTAVLIQTSFYIGSYIVTPHDVEWHVTTSWSRLADQLALPLSMLALFVVFGEEERRMEEEVHAV